MKQNDIYKLIDNFNYNSVEDLKEYTFFKFDDIDKKIIYDAIEWIRNGGDIYQDKNTNTKAKLGPFTFFEIHALIAYKNVFFSTKLNTKEQKLYNLITTAVDKATKTYGKNVSGILYRGIQDLEYKGIQKTCKTRKTVALNRVKSFATDEDSVYEYGENLMTLKVNNVKLFDFNSFLVSIGLARAIEKKITPRNALLFLDGYDNNDMTEYIIPTTYKFKVVNAKQLKFSLNV